MLANWMFFWNAADWGGAPPEPEPEVQAARRSNEGGGDWRGSYPLDEDYWETRERYIKRMLQVTEIHHAQRSDQSPDALPPQQDGSPVSLSSVGTSPDPSVAFDQLAREQALAVAQARAAPTRAALKAAGARVAETSARLARLRDQYELEALAILIASTI